MRYYTGIVLDPGLPGCGAGRPDPAADPRICLYATGRGPGAAFLLLFGSLIGSYINVPITELTGPPVRSGEIVDFFGMRYVVPVVVSRGTILAVNVGGAVIPTLMSAYLLIPGVFPAHHQRAGRHQQHTRARLRPAHCIRGGSRHNMDRDRSERQHADAVVRCDEHADAALKPGSVMADMEI